MESPSFERRTAISAAANVIRRLFSEPFRFEDFPRDDERGTIYTEPLPTELAIENNRPAIFPAEGYLRDGLDILRGQTIWAIDGGILTWQFPNGLLIVGRAVVSRMSFTGTETVQRVFDVPVIPFVLYPPVQQTGEIELRDFESISQEYLQYVIGNLPTLSAGATEVGTTDYFSDSEQFLANLPENYYAASGVGSTTLARYVDRIRDTAELVAFLFALEKAEAGNIVMRDGRIHGGAGFLTGLVRDGNQEEGDVDSGNEIVRSLINSIRNAIDRGVQVVGIIKHPRSNYCTRWYRDNDVESARYTSTDSLLFYREIEPLPEERSTRIYGAGKRSCFWQLREGRTNQDEPVDLDSETGRRLVHWFYQNTGFFYLKPKEGILPIRIDFILHNNHYRSWFANDLAEKIYTLCTGSGSPTGLPQPITIVDSYAKIHRPELKRSIEGMITQFEASDDPEDLNIARELRAYLDIYYRGVV